MPGVHRGQPASRYTPEIGWGWLDPTGLGGRDRGVNFTPPPNALQRDFLLPGTQHVFAVDLPDGSYAVKTYNGDWIGTSRSNVQLEGKDFGASNAGAGSVSEKVSQPVLVTDGQLNLVMTGSSSRLNGIEITPLLLAPGPHAGRPDHRRVVGERLTQLDGHGRLRRVPGVPQGRRRAAAVALGDVTTTTFVDTDARRRPGYEYHVVALDPSGLESVPTDTLDVTTVDPDVPTAAVPTGLRLGDVNKNDVTFTWDAVDGGALFYQVLRQAKDGRSWSSRGPPTGPGPTPRRTRPRLHYRVASVRGGPVGRVRGRRDHAVVTTCPPGRAAGPLTRRGRHGRRRLRRLAPPGPRPATSRSTSTATA